jgi:predicted GH43/DUF377 family glycosyl hydrolase
MPSGTDIMTHSPLVLRPDPARTVLRPFALDAPDGRPDRIVERVLGLDQEMVGQELQRVMDGLTDRHRDVEGTIWRRFGEAKEALSLGDLPEDRARLIGAYFLEEYAFEAAALFNPSMVLHPDQSGAKPGGVRFALSLRGIGEGHVSSVTFRLGFWNPRDGFTVEEPSGVAVAPRVGHGDGDDDKVCILCEGSTHPSETVLFPTTPAQARGIEDMRLVHLEEDDGSIRQLGTYTAFSGSATTCELMEVQDYRTFTLRKMTGDAAKKGLALFPKKLGGRYAAIGRQDGENLWFLESDSLTHWEGGRKILEPKYFWEFVQIGNCGSPIEIDEGWLLLTHGVGSVRNYCVGAALLDRDDPTRVLGRMTLPLVHPSPKERDGYVPNVVYSCGGIVHDRTLLLPYGVADDFTAFAHVAVDDLLAALE